MLGKNLVQASKAPQTTPPSPSKDSQICILDDRHFRFDDLPNKILVPNYGSKLRQIFTQTHCIQNTKYFHSFSLSLHIIAKWRCVFVVRKCKIVFTCLQSVTKNIFLLSLGQRFFKCHSPRLWLVSGRNQVLLLVEKRCLIYH